jgi:hypothetical protein
LPIEMVTIFLCFAAADRTAAGMIAARLESAAEVRVILDAIDGQTLHTAWEGGAASTGIVLLLSPESVKAGLGRDDWAGLLEHIQANAEPPIFRVLVQACPFPRLLERNRFLCWEDQASTLRVLQQWAISLHPSASGGFDPAVQPHFAGRTKELERLRASLVDQPGSIAITGVSRCGKTSLAQEMARRDQSFFRKIVWVSCRGRSRSCILHELAAQLGLDSPQPVEHSVVRLFQQHRFLAVLDEIEADGLVHALSGGAASVVITRPLPLAGLPFLELNPKPAPEPGVPESPEQQLVWEAMTVCRTDEVPVGLAAAIAEIPVDRAVGICRALAQKHLIDLLDSAGGGTYRVCWPAALRQPREDEMRRRHARLMPVWFRSNIAEAWTALNWACESAWDAAVPLGKQLFAHLKSESRSEEVVAVLDQMETAAKRHGDLEALEFVYYERSWISGTPWFRPGQAGAEQTSFDFAV